jgi:hypothetical protein
VLRALRARRPAPRGHGIVDHRPFEPVLAALRAKGVAALPGRRAALRAYRDELERVDPDTLGRHEALAYWVNLYNAGALDLAAAALDVGTVLRVPGGFSSTWATVAGERLSLDAIEHGKIRRFGDPRIHAALVCGSASCPTLRFEPYRGDIVHEQLDDQMRSFLRHGGARVAEETGTLVLSRIFLWYGADVVRPHRMPAWIPASRKRLVHALRPWLGDEVRAWVAATRPRIAFQPYDWSLACAVR